MGTDNTNVLSIGLTYCRGGRRDLNDQFFPYVICEYPLISDLVLAQFNSFIFDDLEVNYIFNFQMQN